VEYYQYGSFYGRIKLGAYQSPAAEVSAANETAIAQLLSLGGALFNWKSKRKGKAAI